MQVKLGAAAKHSAAYAAWPGLSHTQPGCVNTSSAANVFAAADANTLERQTGRSSFSCRAAASSC